MFSVKNEYTGESIVYCDDEGCPITAKDETPKGFIHSPFTIWFYGLSGSGKSVVGKMLYDILKKYTDKIIFLDANELRRTVSSDLGYSFHDRKANVARTAFIAKLLNSQGMSCIVSMTTATHDMRIQAMEIIGDSNCHFIYLSTPLNVCIARDPKKIYSKRVPYLSGTDDKKFEEPTIGENVLFTLDTSVVTREEIQVILSGFVARRILRGESDGEAHKFTCKS